MKYNLLDDCIAKYFREKRLSAKYSSYYVAERLGIPKSTYYYYEIGKVSMPKDTMKKLLSLYNEDGDELLDEMQKACNRYLTDLYAYLHGYEVSVSFMEGEQDAGL